jgi:hypothetical protein
VTPEKSSKVAPAHIETRGKSERPIWARVPKGWIFLVLMALAWLGIYLIWNGVLLLTHS